MAFQNYRGDGGDRETEMEKGREVGTGRGLGERESHALQ